MTSSILGKPFPVFHYQTLPMFIGINFKHKRAVIPLSLIEEVIGKGGFGLDLMTWICDESFEAFVLIDR